MRLKYINMGKLNGRECVRIGLGYNKIHSSWTDLLVFEKIKDQFRKVRFEWVDNGGCR